MERDGVNGRMGCFVWRKQAMLHHSTVAAQLGGSRPYVVALHSGSTAGWGRMGGAEWRKQTMTQDSTLATQWQHSIVAEAVL
eukprot:1158911-Pelagomonas_calceolata.AAC.3